MNNRLIGLIQLLSTRCIKRGYILLLSILILVSALSSYGVSAQKPKIIEVKPEIPTSYYSFSDGMGLFTYRGKCGYLGADGKVAIEPKYNRGILFSEGVALVEDVNKNLVIIDKKGKELFTSKEFNLPDLTDGYFQNGAVIVPTKDNKRYVIIDKAGKELGTVQKNGYVPKGKLSSGVIVWGLNNSNKIKLTDETGKELTNEIVTGFGANNMPKLNFKDDLLAVPNFDKSWNVIDIAGKKVFKDDFEELGQPSEGLIAFKKYGKWGYMDYKGKISIKPQYESAHDFSNGLAAVSVNGKVGFIDKNNKRIIAPKFNAEPKLNLSSIAYYQFGSNGIALIPDNYGSVIDKSGNVLLKAASNTTILYKGDKVICFFNNGKSKLYKIQ